MGGRLGQGGGSATPYPPRRPPAGGWGRPLGGPGHAGTHRSTRPAPRCRGAPPAAGPPPSARPACCAAPGGGGEGGAVCPDSNGHRVHGTASVKPKGKSIGLTVGYVEEGATLPPTPSWARSRPFRCRRSRRCSLVMTSTSPPRPPCPIGGRPTACPQTSRLSAPPQVGRAGHRHQTVESLQQTKKGKQFWPAVKIVCQPPNW